jgi:hypothetical protein
MFGTILVWLPRLLRKKKLGFSNYCVYDYVLHLPWNSIKELVPSVSKPTLYLHYTMYRKWLIDFIISTHYVFFKLFHLHVFNQNVNLSLFVSKMWDFEDIDITECVWL